MVKTLTDTPVEVVAKINADKLTSVDAEGLLKTGDACRTAGLHFCRHTERSLSCSTCPYAASQVFTIAGQERL